MKNVLLNKIMINIENTNKYEKAKLPEIRYGLETLYITITKTIVILTSAYFLGIIKELLLILLFYGLLRLSGFGLHAKKSWQCWISSLLTFLLLPYLIKVIELSIASKIIISVFSIVFISIYAPADTEKRPLIHKEKRIKFKIVCILTSIALTMYLFITKNIIIQNSIIASFIIECVMISPLTYKIFRLRYANYRFYIPSKTVSSSV